MAACIECGSQLPPPRRGGQRKKCETCSPPRVRPAKAAPPAAPPGKARTVKQSGKKPAAKKAPARRRPTVVPMPAADPEPESVLDATRQLLTRTRRTGTPGGQAALVLARRIDMGDDSGSSIAALVKQLQATLAEVTRDADTTTSPLDELRARRAQKKAR